MRGTGGGEKEEEKEEKKEKKGRKRKEERRSGGTAAEDEAVGMKISKRVVVTWANHVQHVIAHPRTQPGPKFAAKLEEKATQIQRKKNQIPPKLTCMTAQDGHYLHHCSHHHRHYHNHLRLLTVQSHPPRHGPPNNPPRNQK